MNSKNDLIIYYQILFCYAPDNFISDDDFEALAFNSWNDVLEFIKSPVLKKLDYLDPEECSIVLDRLRKLSIRFKIMTDFNNVNILL
jgi:hypothetical protein